MEKWMSSRESTWDVSKNTAPKCAALYAEVPSSHCPFSWCGNICPHLTMGRIRPLCLEDRKAWCRRPRLLFLNCSEELGGKPSLPIRKSLSSSATHVVTPEMSGNSLREEACPRCTLGVQFTFVAKKHSKELTSWQKDSYVALPLF